MRKYKNGHGDEVRDDIIDFIVWYIGKHGYSPTVREIGQGVGLRSPSSVHAHLVKLQNDGRIETDAGFNSPRAIRIPEMVHYIPGKADRYAKE